MDTIVDVNDTHAVLPAPQASTAWLIGTARAKAPFFTGWRRLAVGLTALVGALTTFLAAVLCVSIFILDHGGESIYGQSLLFSGRCKNVTRANLWIHLAINILASAVLGSSNFFMQTLIAPTRREVDKAHASGKWLEIGVQSIWNLRFVSRRNAIFWSLFALSSVPIHLLFNGVVLESKASTGYQLVIASEGFTEGAPFMFPPVTDPSEFGTGGPITISKVQEAVTSDKTKGNWDKISFAECMRRYNDPHVPLVDYRHAIMVLANDNGTLPSGWSRRQVVKNLTAGHFSDVDSLNSLWWAETFDKTQLVSAQSQGANKISVELPSEFDNLNTETGVMTMNKKFIRPEYQTMKVQYCLSERFVAPCRLNIANPILLTVCIMCALKWVLCILYLVFGSWGKEDRLLTIGDAVESFIMNPDDETKGMCTLDFQDLVNSNRPLQGSLRSDYGNLNKPREWQPRSRKVGKAAPRAIWILSYLFIGCSLIVGIVMLGLSASHQPITTSSFVHSAGNAQVGFPGLENQTLMTMTVIANIPQLLLSLCYLAVNGLLTRMLSEFEWVGFSTKYQSLRVTYPKGEQRTSLRLQLPYRWSIPLLVVSILLHWVYSNCIYASNYEGYQAWWPYNINTDLAMHHSSKAILIAFMMSIATASAPIILSFAKIPGNMVMAGSRSAVISAACHCLPLSKSYPTNPDSKKSGTGGLNEKIPASQPLMQDGESNALGAMATRKLMWGDVRALGSADVPPGNQQAGHLAFGTVEQDVAPPIQGELYSGN